MRVRGERNRQLNSDLLRGVEMAAVNRREPGMERQLGIRRRLLPFHFDEIARGKQAVVPDPAAFLSGPGPGAKLQTSRFGEIKNLEFNCPGQFEQVPLRIVRCEQDGNRLVTREAVPIYARGEQLSEF